MENILRSLASSKTKQNKIILVMKKLQKVANTHIWGSRTIKC